MARLDSGHEMNKAGLLLLMIVANAVAGTVTATERLVGSVAANIAGAGCRRLVQVSVVLDPLPLKSCSWINPTPRPHHVRVFWLPTMLLAESRSVRLNSNRRASEKTPPGTMTDSTAAALIVPVTLSAGEL